MAEQAERKSLHLVELRASNFMGLRTVVVELTENGVVEVTGPNGAGKTSFMRAMESLVGGSKVHPTRAIRNGEDSAELLGRFKGSAGEIEVERRFKKDPKGGESSTVVVRGADGSRYDKPQTILDAMFNATLDPELFRNMVTEKQVEVLRELAGLNFGPLEGKIADLYDKRTETNRKGGDLAARFKAMTAPPADLPEKPVDVDQLLREQNELQTVRQQNAAAQHALTSLKRDVESATADVERQRTNVDRLEHELEQAKKAMLLGAERLTAAADAFNFQHQIVAQLVEPDVGSVSAKISAAQATNIAIARAADRKKVELELEALRKQSAELGTSIDTLRKEKSDAIANAKFPVEGLGLGTDGPPSQPNYVTFNGLPFDQVNMAQQLRVSTVVCLARNPTIRVLGIRRGSDLDSKHLAVIAEEAKKQDAQIFIERVADKGSVGLVFEAGELVSPKPPEKTDQPDLGLKLVRGGGAA